jgi:glycolate oxidase FAD binding subunit
MSNTAKPRNEAEIVTAVREARSASTPIEIVGGGTKRGLGRPTQTAVTMDMSDLSGISLYEPSELVIGAAAGTSLSSINAALAENRQQLAFEVPDFSKLFGTDGSPTIGAVAATNLSGPRRILSGAARDALLGVRMVTGHGEAVKNGGRVMKNVTGYDLVKLSAGAHGTLGVLTEVTFKVLPIPETETTLVFDGLSDADAVSCMAAGLGSPFEVSGAAHHARSTVRAMARHRGAPASGIEGFADQVDYRFWRAGQTAQAPRRRLADGCGRCQPSCGGWCATAHSLRDEPEHAIWRISVQPSHGPRIGHVVRNSLDGEVVYDWGGGLIWAPCRWSHADAGAQVLRAATARPAVTRRCSVRPRPCAPPCRVPSRASRQSPS